jgi:hypothetical protein
MTHGARAIVLGAWLIVGQRWAGVEAWEAMPAPGAPFRSRAVCERQMPAAGPAWREVRCVRAGDFRKYPRATMWDQLSRRAGEPEWLRDFEW